jgi:hypothetical protein
VRGDHDLRVGLGSADLGYGGGAGLDAGHQIPLLALLGGGLDHLLLDHVPGLNLDLLLLAREVHANAEVAQLLVPLEGGHLSSVELRLAANELRIVDVDLVSKQARALEDEVSVGLVELVDDLLGDGGRVHLGAEAGRLGRGGDDARVLDLEPGL